MRQRTPSRTARASRPRPGDRLEAPRDPIAFATPRELRAWFAKHAATEKELWIKYYKVRAAKTSVRYQEALDEALCVGWIDGQVRSIDDESYMQRWTPRRKGSSWSAVNIAKAVALIATGRMKKGGLVAFEARDKDAGMRDSFENPPQELPPELEKELRKDKAAWSFWKTQPPSYRKAATWIVVSAKRADTRERRMRLLIERSARGERIPQLVSPGKKRSAKRSSTSK